MQWRPWRPWQPWQWPESPLLPDPPSASSQVAMEPLSEPGRRHGPAHGAAHPPLTAPVDRARLYDLAELLLSELIPGWHKDDLCHDDGDDAEVDDDDAEDAEDEVLSLRLPDPVVDASYRACMLEAEHYLVHCEGFDAEGVVVVGLRQHLQLALAQAAQPAPRRAGQRHRPPGYP